jgi:hypothetical protein
MMRSRAMSVAAAALLALTMALILTAAAAGAEEATWSGLEQPTPTGAEWPVGLGNIGDIQFIAPNRGLLITEGHPPTVPSGLWAYNGAQWHEYATVCGASENLANNGGRIAWASPDEFWTISDGRKGQVNESVGTGFEKVPPLEDNTLCHFAGGQIVGSYAHPAFRADSYQLMHAAACISPTDCWFGGNPLEEPQIGAFHLHWNGSSLEEQPYLGEGHAIESMLALEGHIYESVLVTPFDRGQGDTSPVVHRINPEGAASTFEPEEGVFGELPKDLYQPAERPLALNFLHLSTADGALWAAAGQDFSRQIEPPEKTGQVTVVRAVKRSFTQLIGPEHPLGPILPADKGEEESLLGSESAGGSIAANASVAAIAAEPGTGTAWVALAPAEGSAAAESSSERAVLIHLSAEGTVMGEVTLPSVSEEEQGIGPKGAAAKLVCPAANNCWLATTQGWLFHLTTARERILDAEGELRDPRESEYFSGTVITYRPQDQGLPQVTPDAPPEDNSGLHEEALQLGSFAEVKVAPAESKVRVPLLSHFHSRLIHRTTLELGFRLAVKARIRLLAKRRKELVASTALKTFKAGNHSLLLRLDPKRWPTKLSLQTHALAPLPTVTVKEPVGGPEHASVGENTESTGLTVLPHVPSFTGLKGLL